MKVARGQGAKWVLGGSVSVRLIIAGSNLAMMYIAAPKDFGVSAVALGQFTVLGAICEYGMYSGLLARGSSLGSWAPHARWICSRAAWVAVIIGLMLAKEYDASDGRDHFISRVVLLPQLFASINVLPYRALAIQRAKLKEVAQIEVCSAVVFGLAMLTLGVLGVSDIATLTVPHSAAAMATLALYRNGVAIPLAQWSRRVKVLIVGNFFIAAGALVERIVWQIEILAMEYMGIEDGVVGLFRGATNTAGQATQILSGVLVTVSLTRVADLRSSSVASGRILRSGLAAVISLGTTASILMSLALPQVLKVGLPANWERSSSVSGLMALLLVPKLIAAIGTPHLLASSAHSSAWLVANICRILIVPAALAVQLSRRPVVTLESLVGASVVAWWLTEGAIMMAMLAVSRGGLKQSRALLLNGAGAVLATGAMYFYQAGLVGLFEQRSPALLVASGLAVIHVFINRITWVESLSRLGFYRPKTEANL